MVNSGAIFKLRKEEYGARGLPGDNYTSPVATITLPHPE